MITGGPGVGKTSLLHALEARGMATVPETARAMIMEQQSNSGDALPWKNKKLYMDTMFQRSVESFESAQRDFRGADPVFFDRSFLDALCYASLEGLYVEPEMMAYATARRFNPMVFILPPWKGIYHTDAQRKQDWNEAVFTYNKMIQTYRGHQYELIEVPRCSVDARADFVLGQIRNG